MYDGWQRTPARMNAFESILFQSDNEMDKKCGFHGLILLLNIPTAIKQFK